jgi:large subunit ribosomal protein L32
MPLPSFRNSRSKVRRRRSHHALKPISVATCPKCEAILLPHRACKKCGAYADRTVAKGMDEVKKVIKKTAAKKAVAKKAPAKKTSSKPGHEGHDHE